MGGKVLSKLGVLTEKGTADGGKRGRREEGDGLKKKKESQPEWCQLVKKIQSIVARILGEKGKGWRRRGKTREYQKRPA